MTELSQLDARPLVIWVEDTFRIIRRARVASGVILQGIARLGMPVEVWQQGQHWQAQIEAIEYLCLVKEARDKRKQQGLPFPLGFIVQPQEPMIEPGALILEPRAVRAEPRWAEVASFEEARKLTNLGSE